MRMALTLITAAAFTTSGFVGCASDDTPAVAPETTTSAGASTGATPDGTGSDEGATDTGGSGDTSAADTGADSGSGGDSGSTDGGEPFEGVTWHETVRAIVEVQCSECHSADGVGPFPLTAYDEVVALGTLVLDAVVGRRMPPWMPDPDCHPIANQRILDEADIADIAAWVEDGMHEGDPADYVAPAPSQGALVGDPSLILDAGLDYVANPLLPDDYRCLPLDHVFAQDTFITGINVQPDRTKLVHHVLLYAVEADLLSQLQSKDDAEDGPGYSCFGGAGLSSQMVGGWVPGSVPFVGPGDTAIVIPAGAKIVMQVHYNTVPLAGVAPEPDRTTVQLWTLPEGEVPLKRLSFVSLAYGGISIESGDPESIQKRTFPVPVPLTIVGTTPHMHTLGKRIDVQLRRAVQTEAPGSTEWATEACIVDVPQWDFNWQQFYLYPEGQAVVALPGDKIDLTCVYDNSAANQPVINGEQLEPKHVTWGEGTLDEMCMNYLLVTTAYDGAESGTCPTFSKCLPLCDEADGQCFLSCLIADGVSCAECMIPQMAACGQGFCPGKLIKAAQCLGGCEDGLQDCLLGECSSEVDALYGCLEPHIKAGSCDADFAACGAEFSAE